MNRTQSPVRRTFTVNPETGKYIETQSMRSQQLTDAQLCRHNIEVVSVAYESKMPEEVIVIELENFKYGVKNMTYSQADNTITIEYYTQDEIDEIKQKKQRITPRTITFPYETSVEINFGKIIDSEFNGIINTIEKNNANYINRKLSEYKRGKNEQNTLNARRRPVITKNPGVSFLDLPNFANLNTEQQDEVMKSLGKTTLAALFVALLATMYSKMKGGGLTDEQINQLNTSNLSEKELEQILSSLNLSREELVKIAKVIERKVDKTEVKTEIDKLPENVQTEIKTNIDKDFPGFNLEEGETIFGSLFGGKRRRTNKKRRTNKRRNNKNKSNRR